MATTLKQIRKDTYTWQLVEVTGVQEAAVQYEVSVAVPRRKLQEYRIPGLNAANVWERIEALKHGLSIGIVDALCKDLAVSRKELARVAGVPERTLIRKIQSGRLTSNQSERMLRVALLFARAVEVLGTKARALQWVKASRQQLQGRTPLEMVDTELGAQEVMNLLGRIEHGVFS